MTDIPGQLLHRPKRGTAVKITKIHGRPRVRKTLHGYTIEFVADGPTKVRYTPKPLTPSPEETKTSTGGE